MSVTPKALWQWDTTDPNNPYPTGYGVGTKPTTTKTGLCPQDVRDFAGVPLWYRGNPPREFSDTQIIQQIRRAEDQFELETGILLAPTYIASSPYRTAPEAVSGNVSPTSPDGAMHLGVDYDLEDTVYDFRFNTAEGDGWLVCPMHYKPLRIFNSDPTAVKSFNYSYPLLNDYFNVDPSWYVETRDFGYLRIVPSKNVQMLPLFALQLSVAGFSNNLPGGWVIMYTAGFAPSDYKGRFSFVLNAILALTSVNILAMLQGTVNMGSQEVTVQADGVATTQKFDPKGPYAGLISNFKNTYTELSEQAYWLCGGLSVQTL
jgi:hypothetical protein